MSIYITPMVRTRSQKETRQQYRSGKKGESSDFLAMLRREVGPAVPTQRQDGFAQSRAPASQAAEGAQIETLLQRIEQVNGQIAAWLL